MKLFLVVLSAVLLNEVLAKTPFVPHRRRGPPDADPPHERANTPDLNTIEMPVDHNDPTDRRTWDMSYYNSSQFFQPGGPIFIFLGGEWSIEPTRLMGGQIYALAQKTYGYMYYTEHRYYGQSFPTEDASTESLKYLTVDQALEDVAFFIKAQKVSNEAFAESKVVVIGGSYSATLATWARLKYPHLIDIAYASSAPLRAVADFTEYYQVVAENLGKVSPQCTEVIQEAFSTLAVLLETEEGRQNVTELYHMCETVQNTEPYRSYFFSTLAGIFAGTVQYANEGDIETVCNDFLGQEGEPVEQLGNYLAEYYELEDDCLINYDDYVSIYSQPDMDRSWQYQTCTQFGFYQTSSSSESVFGDSFIVDMYYQMCTDLYGEKFTAELNNASIDRTNIVYGSTDLAISNLISVHGSVDPWHTLGILESKSDTVVTIYVEDASHCQDLNTVTDADSAQLKEAKLQVQDLIVKWLRE